MQTIAIEGVGRLGVELGLDAGLSGIIGLSLGAIQGNIITNPGTTLEKAFSAIKPQLFSSLSQYGVTKLGISLGLDPRISSLIGAPISAGIGTAFDTGRNAGITIVNSVQAGMIQGAIAYGLSFTGTQSPLFGSLMSRDITNNLALAIGRDGLFNTVFNILGKTALNVVNVVGGVAKTVFEGVTSFGTTIQQNGLAGALESLATSMFGRATQEAITQKGGMQQVLANTPRTQAALPNGQTVSELKIDNSASLFFDNESRLIGRKDEGIYQLGEFGYDSFGNFGVLVGEINYDMGNNLDLYAQIKDGHVYDIRINADKEMVFQATPERPDQPIFIQAPQGQQQSSSSFNFWNTVFNLAPQGMSLFMHEGVANAGEIAVNTASHVAGQLIDIALLSGFSLFETHPPGTAPSYFESGSPFRDKLNQIGVSDSAIKPVAVFETSATDITEFFFLKAEYLKVRNAFIDIRNNQPNKEFVPLAYSGGARALFPAFSESLYNGFGIKTAVLVGAPMVSTKVHSGPLERIINIYGSEDMFLTGPTPIAKRFTHDEHSLETINIELQGIKHNDKGSYFYTNPKDATPEQIRASNFIARLTQASLDKTSLTQFFESLEQRIGNPTSEIYTDPTTHIAHTIKTYKVDWSKLPENF